MDDLFESVALYIDFNSLSALTEYHTSHRVQWSDRVRTKREWVPREISSPSLFNAYVMSNEAKGHFNDKLSSLYLTVSPDSGSRIILSYVISCASADITRCDERDGKDKTFGQLMSQGVIGDYVADWFNPFHIARLDNLRLIVDHYTCEVTLDGMLFGPDAELLIEQSVARQNEAGFILLNEKYLTAVIDTITKSRENPRYFEFNGNKRSKLTPEFYRTMHQRLNLLFRQKT